MSGTVGASEAALKAGVSREALVRLVQLRRLKGHRDGRHWFVDAADLERLISEQQAAGGREPQQSA